MKTARFILVCVALISGCSTPYKPNGFMGGFTETRLAPDAFRVSFRGNGYTSGERVQDFAMLRAAEISLTHGFSYFAIMNEQDGIAGATSLYDKHAAVTLFKLKTGMLIRCFQDKPETFALDAAYLRQSIKQKYKMK